MRPAFSASVRAFLVSENGICNSQPYWLMRNFNSHVEVECLPGAGGWNYDYFTINAAYGRKIKDKILYMSGRFQSSWGDMCGLKTYASLENDMFDAQMNALECSVGDHMHPDGEMEMQTYENIGFAYDYLEEIAPYCYGGKFLSNLGVYITDDWDTNNGISKILLCLLLLFLLQLN